MRKMQFAACHERKTVGSKSKDLLWILAFALTMALVACGDDKGSSPEGLPDEVANMDELEEFKCDDSVIGEIVYVKSKVNGNTIILPSTGDCSGQYCRTIANDDVGCYWSRSLGEDRSLNAASMYFNTIEALEIYHYDDERCKGFCVRPVRRRNNP